MVSFVDRKTLIDKGAEFVGGDEGVFCSLIEGEIVRFYGGDDGAWWEIGAYHKHWLPEIIKNLSNTVK